MKVLFIISSSETAFWLSEVSHPYWHFTERGVEVDFASPKGGKVVYDPYSDPYFDKSLEPNDLVSKGFLSDPKVLAKLENTLELKVVDLSAYDAIHIAGGRGATFDLFPNEELAKTLEYFWSKDKVVGAICHGAVALGNIPNRIRGLQEPDSLLRLTSSYRPCLEATSSFLTTLKRSLKRPVPSTPAPRPTRPKSLSTAS